MTVKHLMAIALKVLSIWLLVQILLNLPSLLLILSSVEVYRQESVPEGAFLLLMLFFLIFGGATVVTINRTANSALIEAEASKTNSTNRFDQKALLQISGIFFVVDAISELPRSLWFIPMAKEIGFIDLLTTTGLVFELIIGIWLLTNSCVFRRT